MTRTVRYLFLGAFLVSLSVFAAAPAIPVQVKLTKPYKGSKTTERGANTIETDDLEESIDDCSSNFRLAATAAEFAEILRKSYWAKGATLGSVLERAQKLNQDFAGNADVIELVDLISKANKLMKQTENEESAEEIEYLIEEQENH